MIWFTTLVLIIGSAGQQCQRAYDTDPEVKP